VLYDGCVFPAPPPPPQPLPLAPSVRVELALDETFFFAAGGIAGLLVVFCLVGCLMRRHSNRHSDRTTVYSVYCCCVGARVVSEADAAAAQLLPVLGIPVPPHAHQHMSNDRWAAPRSNNSHPNGGFGQTTQASVGGAPKPSPQARSWGEDDGGKFVAPRERAARSWGEDDGGKFVAPRERAAVSRDRPLRPAGVRRQQRYSADDARLRSAVGGVVGAAAATAARRISIELRRARPSDGALPGALEGRGGSSAMPRELIAARQQADSASRPLSLSPDIAIHLQSESPFGSGDVHAPVRQQPPPAYAAPLRQQRRRHSMEDLQSAVGASAAAAASSAAPKQRAPRRARYSQGDVRDAVGAAAAPTGARREPALRQRRRSLEG
jgi:hypothetical protein